jgi:hypothetical protein
MYSFSETEFMPRSGFVRTDAWGSFESRLSSFAQPWAQAPHAEPLTIAAPVAAAPFAGRFFGQLASSILSLDDQQAAFQLAHAAPLFDSNPIGAAPHLASAHFGDAPATISADAFAGAMPAAAPSFGDADHRPQGLSQRLTSGDDGPAPTNVHNLARSGDPSDDRQGTSPLLSSGDDWPATVWLPDLVRGGDDPAAGAPAGQSFRPLPDMSLEGLGFLSPSPDFVPPGAPEPPAPPQVDWSSLIGSSPPLTGEADPAAGGGLSLDLFSIDPVGGMIDVSNPISGAPAHDAANDPNWLSRHIAQIQ